MRRWRTTGGSLVRAVHTVVRADRRGAVLAAGLQVVGAVSGLGVVLASQLALEGLLSRGGDQTSLVVGLVLLAVATAVSGSVGALQALQQRVLAERVSQRVWGQLLRSVASVDLLTFESTAFLRRLDRVRGNAVGRPVAVVSSLLGLGGSLVGVAALSVALLAVEPLLVPILLTAGVPAVLISRRVRDAEFTFATTATPVTQHRGYLRLLLSHRVAAAELRAFDMAGELVRRHDEDDHGYLGLLRGHVRRRQGYALLTVAAASLALTAALLAIVALLDAGRITLPEAGAAAIAARLLGGQLSTVFRSVGSLIESGPFLRDLEQFLTAHPARPSRGALHDLRSEVRATGVRFSYPGREQPALDDVTVVVPRGSVVALVGENGSGKTTLAKVVAGLYSPQAGAVCWDGAPAAPDDLRASVSVLFQDFLRYQMSVQDNVVLSDSSRPTDPARAREALGRVGIGEVVDGLPRGADTVLGLEMDDGTDLSGGQWQRLALARALYRDAPLVVLDEPTAAMDPRAEHELFADVRAVLDGRSALLISHRYSSVRLADHIYVMAGGRVVEEGTHEQLVARGGQYAELYALQAVAYLE